LNIKIKHESGFILRVQNENGHEIIVDTTKSKGGKDLGFRPLELFLASLASCSSFDVLMILTKYKKSFNNYRVEVTGDRRQKIPQVFTNINIKFFLNSTEIKCNQVKKALQLSLDKYCSVSKMLENKVKITADLEFNGEIHQQVFVK
jgi:putative redox protein